MHSDKMVISLDLMMSRIRGISFPPFDLVVAIERGGILPAYLVSRYLDIPMESLSLNFRDESHQPKYKEPQLEKPLTFKANGKKILLVDDVSNTGATFKKAIELLPGSQITTLVITGNADFSLFGPHDRCVEWPWSPINS